MKCNPQRTLDMQRAKEWEEKAKQEQEYINSLSEEEREKYLAAKKKRQEEAWDRFRCMMSIYDKAGIPKYY
jgi:hypothetical protein